MDEETGQPSSIRFFMRTQGIAPSFVFEAETRHALLLFALSAGEVGRGLGDVDLGEERRTRQLAWPFANS